MNGLCYTNKDGTGKCVKHTIFSPFGMMKIPPGDLPVKRKTKHSIFFFWTGLTLQTQNDFNILNLHILSRLITVDRHCLNYVLMMSVV